MTLTFQVSDFGRTFATRERGAELRRQLLEQAEGHGEIIVDFADVTNVSYSFADEFLGKLCAEAPVRVERRNLAPRVQEVADRAVARRTGTTVAC